LYWIFQLLINNLKWKKFQLQSFRFHLALQLFGTWCAFILRLFEENRSWIWKLWVFKRYIATLNDLKYKIRQVKHFRWPCWPLAFLYKVSSSNFIWVFWAIPISRNDLNYQLYLKINFLEAVGPFISRDGKKHPPLKIDDISWEVGNTNHHRSRFHEPCLEKIA
jgi:hypothetical protein